jgi:hypothetical protein
MNSHVDTDQPQTREEGARVKPLARTFRSVAISAIAGLAVMASLIVASAGTASAATLDGAATVETPSGGALTGGGSGTLFTIKLAPSTGFTAAVCSGSTTGGNYHVYSYLEPSGTDIANLVVSQGNIGNYGLFDSTGSEIGPFNVPSNDDVSTLPNNLEWGPAVSGDGFLSALLDGPGGTSGVWEAGVACANGAGQVTDYWNTEITFNQSGTDPDRFTWTAVSGDPNNGANPEVPYAIILPVLAAAIVGGTLVIRRRRSSVPVT